MGDFDTLTKAELLKKQRDITNICKELLIQKSEIEERLGNINETQEKTWKDNPETKNLIDKLKNYVENDCKTFKFKALIPISGEFYVENDIWEFPDVYTRFELDNKSSNILSMFKDEYGDCTQKQIKKYLMEFMPEVYEKYINYEKEMKDLDNEISKCAKRFKINLNTFYNFLVEEAEDR